jgi:hypothetical protein
MRACLALIPLAATFLSAPAALAQEPPPAPAPAFDATPRWVPALMAPDAPRTLKWNDGEVIPLGYHLEPRMHSGLVIGGSLMLGVAWLPTTIVGAAGGAPESAIPVFGPFITAGRFSSAGADSTEDGLRRAFQFWLVFDGLQQAAGLAMLIAGRATSRMVLVRDRAGSAKIEWMPAPMSFGSRSAGLGIVGRI